MHCVQITIYLIYKCKMFNFNVLLFIFLLAVQRVLIQSVEMGSRYDEIMSTKPYLPYKMGYLTDWMVEKAKDELNETEETRVKGLAELKKLIEADKNLKCWTDDAYLLQFLRARKFNAKKAFTLLHNFYTVKKDYKEVYPKQLDFDLLHQLYEKGPGGCLPYRDENGAVVLMIRIAKWNADAFTVQTALSCLTALILGCVEDPATQVCGIHIFFDAKGISLKHIRCITPRYIQLLSKALRNTLPVRFKGIHIFNESFIFQYMWSLLKLFLSEKIKNRVHFYGDNAKHLQKFLPKAILPSEYGGDNTSYSESEWCAKEMPSFVEKYVDLHLRGYE